MTSAGLARACLPGTAHLQLHTMTSPRSHLAGNGRRSKSESGRPRDRPSAVEQDLSSRLTRPGQAGLDWTFSVCSPCPSLLSVS